MPLQSVIINNDLLEHVPQLFATEGYNSEHCKHFRHTTHYKQCEPEEGAFYFYHQKGVVKEVWMFDTLEELRLFILSA